MRTKSLFRMILLTFAAVIGVSLLLVSFDTISHADDPVFNEDDIVYMTGHWRFCS